MAEGANVLGSNVVYNTDRSMSTYQKTLQQQQLKAQQAQKALADDLSSVKADGIRQADIPLYNQKFSKWQDITIQASKERDPQKRLMLQSEASKSKNDLLNTVYRSKQEEKARTGIKTHYIGKDPYDDYEEGDWNKFMASEKLSIEDPNYIGDVTQFQLRPDTDTFLKDLNSVNNELLKSKGVYQNTVGKRVTSGNKTGTIFEQVKSVDPKVQAETYATYLATNRKAYKAVQALYPDLATQLPKQQFIEQVAVELAKTNPIRNTDAPRYEWDYKPTKGSGEGDSEGSNTEYKLQNNVPFYSTARVSENGQPTGEVRNKTAESFVGFNVPSITLNPIERAWDVGEGKMAKFDAKNANIAGIGWFPTKNGYEKLITIVDSDGGRYLIPDTYVPVSTKARKEYKKAESTLGSKPQTQQTKPSQGKSYSTKYGSFTEQQLKDTYGDAWKQALDKIKK